MIEALIKAPQSHQKTIGSWTVNIRITDQVYRLARVRRSMNGRAMSRDASTRSLDYFRAVQLIHVQGQEVFIPSTDLSAEISAEPHLNLIRPPLFIGSAASYKSWVDKQTAPTVPRELALDVSFEVGLNRHSDVIFYGTEKTRKNLSSSWQIRAESINHSGVLMTNE
jgi:hypothetical protein